MEDLENNDAPRGSETPRDETSQTKPPFREGDELPPAAQTDQPLARSEVSEPWRPGEKEEQLAQSFRDQPPTAIDRQDRSTVSFVVDNGDSKAVFKPDASGADRELAAYGTDQMLGFDRVPTTARTELEVDGVPTRGSLQEWKEADVPREYVRDFADDSSRQGLQSQQMAVLDYVIANRDRGDGNFLTHGGDLVAFDNADSFPPPGPDGEITSNFVGGWLDRELRPEIVDSANATAPDAYRSMLTGCGIDGPAADAAVARLREVQGGKITGSAFEGRIF
ncbi:MAG TPA: hypothetical protein VGM10_22155 [Actinocrinis sp.]